MKRWSRVFENIPEVITGVAFSTMMLVVFTNVVLRYTMEKSLIWCEEVAAIGFIWTIFVGAAVCYKHKELISVDALISIFPDTLRNIITLIVDICIMIICIIFCYLSFQFSLSAWTKLSLSLQISYTFFDGAATVGFAFMTYYSVQHILNDIKTLKHKHV